MKTLEYLPIDEIRFYGGHRDIDDINILHMNKKTYRIFSDNYMNDNKKCYVVVEIDPKTVK